MVESRTDIAVIGAGPAGLIAAREAAKTGVAVTVFEEHQEIGVPCHCAGLLSLKGLREIRVPVDQSFVQNRLKGAHFFSPSRLSITVERDEPVACVVDRPRFDRFLAERTMRAGADLRLDSKVKDLKRLDGEILLAGDFGTMKADIVVDAEGLASHLIKQIGLQPLPVKRLLPAIQYDLKGVDVDQDHVEVHMGRKLAPGFFAWIIPLDENAARVGLACEGDNPYQRLRRFIEDRFDGESNLDRVHTRSGFIITHGPVPRSFHDNFIAIGDVAGQVKPTTGGGVIWGGICAMIAGRVAAEAIEARSFTKGFFGNYETLWRKRLEREIRFTLLARKIANRLSDETVDKVFKSVTESDLQEELSMDGDIDFQARAILNVARKKDILKILLSSASDLIGYLRQ